MNLDKYIKNGGDKEIRKILLHVACNKRTLSLGFLYLVLFRFHQETASMGLTVPIHHYISAMFVFGPRFKCVPAKFTHVKLRFPFFQLSFGYHVRRHDNQGTGHDKFSLKSHKCGAHEANPG